MKNFSPINILAIAGFIALTGCAAIGPYGKFYGDGLAQKIKVALPADDSNVLLFSTVIWDLPIRGVNGGLVNARIQGAAALTTSSLFLTQWSSAKNHLEVTKRIPIDSISSAEYRPGPIQIINRECFLHVIHDDGEVDVVTFSYADLALDCSGTRQLKENLTALILAKGKVKP